MRPHNVRALADRPASAGQRTGKAILDVPEHFDDAAAFGAKGSQEQGLKFSIPAVYSFMRCHKESFVDREGAPTGLKAAPVLNAGLPIIYDNPVPA